MSALRPELLAALRGDRFTQSLGATLDEVGPGHATLRMVVREEQAGPHGLTHGGTVMSLAEAALAAATHAHGTVYMALSVTVHFHTSTRPGDTLIAEAQEQHAGGRTAGYTMRVHDGNGTLVASCQAVVYRTREPFP